MGKINIIIRKSLYSGRLQNIENLGYCPTDFECAKECTLEESLCLRIPF